MEFLLKTNEFGDGGEKGNSDKYKYCCECEWGKVVVDFKVREKIEKTDGSGLLIHNVFFLLLYETSSMTWLQSNLNKWKLKL